MAINKEKNVNIQITFPKEDADQLDTLIVAYAKNKIRTTRSEVLLVSFREYLRRLVLIGNAKKQSKEAEEPQGDKKDA